MSSHVTRRAAGLLLALGVVAAPLSSQSPPASVPTPLVVALLGDEAMAFFGRAPMRISVGRAPETFTAALIPPAPVAVVGGVARGGGSAVVLAYPSTADSALTTYVAFLERSGFARPDRAVPDRGGFVESDPRSLGVLCRDSSRMIVQPVPGAPSGSYLRATLISDPRLGACDQGSRMWAQLDVLPFPELHAPAGVQSRLGSSGGNSDHRSISTILLTRLSATDLLAHYGDQLAAAGWTVARPLTDAGVGLRAVDARDPRGAAWRGMLTVIELAESREVSLHMSRTTSRR